jgi:sulfur relay (sulfurtransferase) DsrC/TusE family protein
VSEAQELLQQMIIRGNALAYQKKRTDWAKIYAHSMIKEENIARKEEHFNILQQLRRAPDASMSFPEKVRV